MRILFALHQFYPETAGGTERVAFNLARMAQHAGHYVQVLAASPGCGANEFVDTTWQGLPVRLVPPALLPPAADISFDPEPRLVQALSGWMQAQRFELMHVLHLMRIGSAVRAAQQVQLPYLVTLSDFYLPCARINLVDLAGQLCPGPFEGRRCGEACEAPPWTPQAYLNRYRQAQGMLAAAGARIAPSPYVARRFAEAFDGLDFQVIPHGLDLPALAAVQASRAAREDARPLQLVYVGSVIPQKGLDVLLRALALLPEAPLRLKVIGGLVGNSGYHVQVRELADARVEFLGHLDAAEVFRHVAQADLACLPSKVPESFSLGLHECAALGVPALVSDCGAPAEHVGAHGCGRAVAVGDPAAWAQALREVLASPAQLQDWSARLPLPLRVEEEAFFYESYYRRLARGSA